MSNSTPLPPIFVDQAEIAGMTGAGDSVQMTFVSHVVTDGAVQAMPVFRVAMTRLAFAELAQSVATFQKDLEAAQTDAAKRSN